ncbi:MAG TPA: acyl-CoA dehydrogenase family protein [Symbiobacteriaceae bacterium]|nr:acyl-CoA dehydrogenase family protein [Symbiobacteriaceae bacterium]
MRFAAYEQGEGLNWWETDPNLQATVARYCTPEMMEWVQPHLSRFGGLCGTKVSPRADYTDKPEGRPRLVAYDRQGEEISKVLYNPGYLQTVAEVFGAGIVAWRHHAPAGAPGPVPPAVTWAMGYMVAMAESGFYCPVALTGACALVVDRFAPPDLRDRYLPGLTATDPAKLTQGATWLTEKTGGSDVGAITTVAHQADDGTWRLTGEKWFASNADAPVALALARPEGAAPGTAGLGLYLIPHTLPDGRRNSYRIRRLKDKLGVIAVASGEVLLEGAAAYQISGPGTGFKQMMEAINLSRVYNAIGSAGLARRCFLESVIYTSKRIAFGKPLVEQPLMRAKLLSMLIDLAAITALAFRAADAFEQGRPLARLLIPIAKARAGDKALQMARAGIESFGGNGYIEEYPMARMLRDAQVLTVWEGPEHILALDLLRMLAKQGPADLMAEIGAQLEGVAYPDAEQAVEYVHGRLGKVPELLHHISLQSGDFAQLQAVRLLNHLADLLSAAYLLEEGKEFEHKRAIARLYVARLMPERPGAAAMLDRAAMEELDGLLEQA